MLASTNFPESGSLVPGSNGYFPYNEWEDCVLVFRDNPEIVWRTAETVPGPSGGERNSHRKDDVSSQGEISLRRISQLTEIILSNFQLSVNLTLCDFEGQKTTQRVELAQIFISVPGPLYSCTMSTFVDVNLTIKANIPSVAICALPVSTSSYESMLLFPLRKEGSLWR